VPFLRAFSLAVGGGTSQGVFKAEEQCYPRDMLHRTVVLALALSAGLYSAGFNATARADDVVECDKSREACDAKILELCPAGAEVLDEQELAGPRYRMTFRCRGAAAEAVAPGVAPAPGAAEGVAPPPANAIQPDNSALTLELRSIDERIAALKAERSQHSLVGPIVLTSVGFAVGFTGLLIATGAADDGDSGSDFDDDGFDDDFDDNADEVNDTLLITGAVIAVAGAGVGTGGLIWLFRRLKARKANQPEIEALKARQEQLRMQGVSYSFSVDPMGGRLLLRGRF
jgi:hypothetical protein